MLTPRVNETLETLLKPARLAACASVAGGAATPHRPETVAPPPQDDAELGSHGTTSTDMTGAW